MGFTRFTIADEVATLTLTRDEKRNALDSKTIEEIRAALAEAEARKARAFVLRARPGAKIWCAGHDLTESLPRGDFEAEPLGRLVRGILESPLPVIALVEGRVIAGGLILVLASDLAAATCTASVSITAAVLDYPLPTSLIATWLGSVGLRVSKELLFTSRDLAAEDARVAGIFNRVVEPSALERLVYDEWCGGIRSGAAEFIALSKRQHNLLAQGAPLPPEKEQALELRRLAILEGEEHGRRLARARERFARNP